MKKKIEHFLKALINGTILKNAETLDFVSAFFVS